MANLRSREEIKVGYRYGKVKGYSDTKHGGDPIRPKNGSHGWQT
jgi:hypothetical protein